MSQISGRGKTFLLALLVLTVASAGILLLWHRRKSFEYGLPITLGSTSAEVQQVLGPLPRRSTSTSNSLRSRSLCNEH